MKRWDDKRWENLNLGDKIFGSVEGVHGPHFCSFALRFWYLYTDCLGGRSRCVLVIIIHTPSYEREMRDDNSPPFFYNRMSRLVCDFACTSINFGILGVNDPTNSPVTSRPLDTRLYGGPEGQTLTPCPLDQIHVMKSYCYPTLQ